MRNFCAMGSADEAPDVFRLEEATIEKLHEAITSGSTTFVEVVERYIARVRAYNGVCSKLGNRR
jgi:amidase